MLSTTASGDEYLQQLGLQCDKYSSESTSRSNVHFYHRGLENLKDSQFVLVLIHGYPQSAYLWRHIVPLLPKDIPLFIPDIPGYGQSTPIKNGTHDKRTVGRAILSALQSKLPSSPSNPVKIVIVGHDRGARIAHRVAVDMPPDQPSQDLLLLGTILIDIVPIVVQWDSFSNSKVATGSFHWPLLANVELATAMITAQGGSTFCLSMLTKWSGSSPSGQAKLTSNNSFDIYSKYFDNPEVVRASCDDYRAGAEEDVDEQKKDQAAGKKIQGETLVIYSKDYLGSRFDIRSVWEDWVTLGARLSVEGIGGGIGHFLCEEAPEETAALIEKFLVSLNLK